MELEIAALSQVICDIYDAAVDPRLWSKALQSACRFVGGFQANLFWQAAATDEAAAIYTYNDNPHFSRLYEEKYVALNPVFPAAIFSEVGKVVAVTDLVPQNELEQTRFFKEWVAPQGITGTLAVTLERELLRASFFAVQFDSGIVDDAARHRLALLVPHLQRAVAVGRLFVKHRSTVMALTETLNHVDTAVFMTAATGNIAFANSAGEAMVAEGALVRVKDNLLSAVDPAADRALKNGLRAIEKGDESMSARGLTLALSDAPDHRWVANVLPLVDGARKSAGEAYDAIAAVFIRNALTSRPAPLETLARQYKLTASEIRVADAIVRVSGLDAIAETLGISRATVKTHLNRIYRKCGARNQGDLIKLIAGIDPKR